MGLTSKESILQELSKLLPTLTALSAAAMALEEKNNESKTDVVDNNQAVDNEREVSSDNIKVDNSTKKHFEEIKTQARTEIDSQISRLDLFERDIPRYGTYDQFCSEYKIPSYRARKLASTLSDAKTEEEVASIESKVKSAVQEALDAKDEQYAHSRECSELYEDDRREERAKLIRYAGDDLLYYEEYGCSKHEFTQWAGDN